MFCPKCRDEFVAGVSVCPDCQISLVETLPAPDEREDGESDEFVTVATFPNSFEASLARGALEANGLPAFVPGEGIGAFGYERTGAREVWAELRVRACDRDRAVELLKEAGHR